MDERSDLIGADAGAVAAAAAETAVDDREASLALWITNVSHAGNHFQNQMVSVLYPVIMADLGFGYAQLGVLNAVRTLFGSGSQVLYGFFAQFARRAVLLAVGNILLAVGGLTSGLVGGYPTFLGARTLAAVGSSAQHPVGSSLLSTYFPKRRSTVLALNTSVAFVGSLVAPLLAALLLTIIGWRQIFVLFSLVTFAIAIAYLFLRDRVGARPATPGGARAKLAAGRASYLRVLRDRNMMIIAGVMMVGAAGRGEGVNLTYLGPHFANDLLLPTVMVGLALSVLQGGGVVGPIILGWLSDRLSRRGVMQVSLLLSALATLWIARVGPSPLLLLPSMLVYGSVVYSRDPLTQGLLADSLGERDRDAAFSVFYFIGFVSAPLWSLVTGVLMERFSFTFAFSTLAVSYLIGMSLLFLMRPSRTAEARGA